MQINRCPKCGGKPIITLKESDNGEGRIVGYRLGCLLCNLSVPIKCDLTNVAEAIAKWNEMTKGVNK